MMNSLIRFIDAALEKKLFLKDEREKHLKKLGLLLQISCEDRENETEIGDQKALNNLIDQGYKKGLFSPNTTEERDAFEAYLYDQLIEDPITVKRKFKDYYRKSPDLATSYLYQLSKDVNYIKIERLKKNIKWIYRGKYGPLEITINLAKPEKDPSDIAKAKDQVEKGRPKCVICKENEHNYWNARMNLRLVPIQLANELWHFQYSPYLYYDEHAIILHDEHRPMKINEKTMDYLFDFVDQYPNYFIGSNADLPIVGGSILNHNHFQAGNYYFPIEEAKVIYSKDLEDMTLELLKWPLSTIRLRSLCREKLNTLIYLILKKWKSYQNMELDIIPYTNNTPNQTITPIVKKIGFMYEVYIILRNNRTNNQFPDGIFHPHRDVHHIKKENIGLIEAMGLAILPGRLKLEMELALDFLLNGTDYPSLEKHRHWLEMLKGKNIDSIEKLQLEIGERFERVIEDSGVFKQTLEGIREFKVFADSCF